MIAEIKSVEYSECSCGYDGVINVDLCIKRRLNEKGFDKIRKKLFDLKIGLDLYDFKIKKV